MSARALQITTPSDREIVMTRVFDAPRRLVVEAFTRPELVKRWLFGPAGWSLEVYECDLRTGGKYRYEWKGPAGERMGMGGVHREVALPDRLVRTEAFDEDWTGGETVATLTFTEDGDTTVVTTTIVYASREARDGALHSGMEQGVAAGYDRVEQILVSLR